MQIDVEASGELKLLSRELGLYLDPGKGLLKKISQTSKTSVILRSELADLVSPAEHHDKTHIFARPGEYEVGGVFVRGLSQSAAEGGFERSHLLYVITMDNISVLALPRILSEPDGELIEDLLPLDIVACKLEQNALPDEMALLTKWVKALNPRLLVIYSSALTLEYVQASFKPLASNLTASIPNYKLLKRDLPEKLQVLWLQAVSNS